MLRFLRNFFSKPSKKQVGVAGLALTVAFVGGLEGTRLVAYRDVVGVPTICQGLTENVKMGDVATQAECDQRFAEELTKFEKGVSSCIGSWAQLPVKTKISIVSWAYNVGIHGACTSTAAKRFNAGDFSGGCAAMKWWDKGRVNGKLIRINGLAKRREAEYRLCLEELK